MREEGEERGVGEVDGLCVVASRPRTEAPNVEVCKILIPIW